MEVDPKEFAPPTPYTTDLEALEKRLGELHDKYDLPYVGSIFGWAASEIRDWREAKDRLWKQQSEPLTPETKAGLERIAAMARESHIAGRKEAGILTETDF